MAPLVSAEEAQRIVVLSGTAVGQAIETKFGTVVTGVGVFAEWVGELYMLGLRRNLWAVEGTNV